MSRLPSPLRVSLLATFVLGASAAAPARAADPVAPARPAATAPAPTFSVVQIGPATLPRSLTADLEAAAAAGLAAAGARVVSRTPASPGEPAPTTLLRGTCEIEGSTYHLHLRLEDAKTGATLVSRDDACEICTEKDAAETANIAASALKTALDQLPPPRPAPAAAPLVIRAKAPPAAPRASGKFPWRRVLPWVAVGAGVAGMGVGVYYLSIDGNLTDLRDDGRYHHIIDTNAWGFEWLAAGAVVSAAGLYFVLTPPHAAASEAPKPTAAPAPRTLGLMVSPQAVTAWGTF